MFAWDELSHHWEISKKEKERDWMWPNMLLPESMKSQKWSGCSLCWPFPRRATLWSFCFLWGSAHDHKFGQKIFSLPSNISFHLQPQGWALAFSSEPGYKDLGPLGLTQQALLSITAWPSLLPFTPHSWTHRCQPGNNLQTIEAWKPGLDTLLATYLLLLAAVEA